jgi:hypothetical protein
MLTCFIHYDGCITLRDAMPRHRQSALWPDTPNVSEDGYLYVTANQLQRQLQLPER